MQNPWLDLPESPPYVLQEDFEAIRRYNRASKDMHFVELRMLPEPFLGCPNAPVVLLNLNPGVGEEDIEQHQQPDFIELSRQNLSHVDDVDYPFYLINPNIQQSPGYQWWYKRLRQLIEDCGHQKVAKSVLCVELFPYHSEKYKAIDVQSQDYSFYLVQQAMVRQAVIIQMRSRELWFKQIPELQSYEH